MLLVILQDTSIQLKVTFKDVTKLIRSIRQVRSPAVCCFFAILILYLCVLDGFSQMSKRIPEQQPVCVWYGWTEKWELWKSILQVLHSTVYYVVICFFARFFLDSSAFFVQVSGLQSASVESWTLWVHPAVLACFSCQTSLHHCLRGQRYLTFIIWGLFTLKCSFG